MSGLGGRETKGEERRQATVEGGVVEADRAATPGPREDHASGPSGEMSAEDRFRLLAENASDVVYLSDRDGRILWASPSVRSVLGVDPEQLVGQAVMAFVHPDDLAMARRHQADVLDGRTVLFQVRGWPVAGQAERWFESLIQPVFDGSGAVTGWTGSVRDVTAIHEARAALERSEQLYRSAMEALHDGVVVHDAQGRFVAVSPSALRLIGLPADQVIGRTASEIGWLTIGPDGAPVAKEEHPVLGTLLDGRPLTDQELHLVNAAGAEHWLRVNTAALRDVDGSIRGMVTSFADVTDQRRRDAELRASEERFRMAFEALDMGVAVLRPEYDDAGRLRDAIVLWANPMCLNGWFRGRSLADVQGRGVTELDPDPDRQRLAIAIYQQVLDTGRPFRGEFPFDLGDGSEPAWYSHRMLRTEEGLIHVAVDVTEAHAQRQALEEAHRLARLGVWWRDSRTGQATWSEEMYRIFERDPALGPLDVAGASEMGGIPVDAFRVLAEARAADGDEWEMERELRHPDGRPLWILTRARVERDAEGMVVAYRGTTQDITERRLAEQILERFNQELEQRVADRTTELEAANEELRSFSYSLSHDLRAPLRSIAGFAGMLDRHNREQLDDEGRHRLANILTATETMGRVIDDLLLYLRLGGGAVTLQPVPIGPLVERLRVAHAALLATSGGRLELEEPAATPLADPTLLDEILGNLVENALHYRRPGVAPVVRLSGIEDDGRVTVTVQDNGIGIAAADRERIFEAFTRLAADESHPGTGIGLAVVRRAARAMGTDVTVDSVVGEGSAFRVTLRAASGWYPQGDSNP